MNIKMLKAALAALILSISGFSSATLIIDIQEYSNNTGTEYFVDIDANKYNSPYYRNLSQDWGWLHTSIAGNWTSIILDISAFDVDFGSGELDTISIFTGAVWLNLGNLAGNSDIWAFTQFDLSGYGWASGQVNAGLQIKMDIDSANTNIWLVTLGKSILTVSDGNSNGSGSNCVPTPGVPCNTIPEPSTIVIIALGVISLASRKLKKH